MTQVVKAIYESGVLKPIEPLKIKEHSQVCIIVESDKELRKRAEKIVQLAHRSCEGLSEKELSVMESARLKSEDFFSHRLSKD